MLTVTRDLDGKKYIIHEANYPDVEESFRVFHFKVKERKPLRCLVVEPRDNAIIIHSYEHSFVAEADPSEVRSFGNWAFAVKQSVIKSWTLDLLQTSTINNFHSKLLMIIDG